MWSGSAGSCDPEKAWPAEVRDVSSRGRRRTAGLRVSGTRRRSVRAGRLPGRGEGLLRRGQARTRRAGCSHRSAGLPGRLPVGRERSRAGRESAPYASTLRQHAARPQPGVRSWGRGERCPAPGRGDRHRVELARPRRVSARNDRELAKRPARLATALDVDRALNGAGVVEGPAASSFRSARLPALPRQVRGGPRTGVGGDGSHQPWRFWIDGDPMVSPYRAHVPRRRAT